MTMTAGTSLEYRVHLGDPVALGEYLARPRVIREGHFCLLSGRHTDRFVAFSAIARDSFALSRIGGWLSAAVATWVPDALVAPSTAGVGLAATIARSLGIPLHLASLDAGSRPVGLHAELRSGSRVVVVNDILTTGEGMRRLAKVVEHAGGATVGAAFFLLRSSLSAIDGIDVPTARVVDLNLPSWPSSECDACSNGLAMEVATDLN